MAEEFEKPQYSEQEQIRRAKLAKYCEEGRDPYTITRFDRTHTSAEVLSNFDALEGKTVRIAGRMMSRRIMGKASARTSMPISKRWISAIFWAWRALCSAPRPARSPCMPRP